MPEDLLEVLEFPVTQISQCFQKQLYNRRHCFYLVNTKQMFIGPKYNLSAGMITDFSFYISLMCVFLNVDIDYTVYISPVVEVTLIFNIIS